MLNNVTMALSSALAEKSMVALMFNFRGVGGSQGRYGNGIAEQYDVAAAIDWLNSQQPVDSSRVGLAGYSFGATVALLCACVDDRVKAVALISIPPGPSQMTQLQGCPRPKLMIGGTNDFVLPIEQAKLMNQEAAEPKQFELIDGADHFWMGYETVLAEKVVTFFEGKLQS